MYKRAAFISSNFPHNYKPHWPLWMQETRSQPWNTIHITFMFNVAFHNNYDMKNTYKVSWHVVGTLEKFEQLQIRKK